MTRTEAEDRIVGRVGDGSGRPPRVYPAGRFCSAEGCNHLLSIYNPGPTCNAHSCDGQPNHMLTCAFCELPFQAKRRDMIYCSRKCLDAAAGQRRDRTGGQGPRASTVEKVRACLAERQGAAATTIIAETGLARCTVLNALKVLKAENRPESAKRPVAATESHEVVAGPQEASIAATEAPPPEAAPAQLRPDEDEEVEGLAAVVRALLPLTGPAQRRILEYAACRFVVNEQE